MTRFLRIAAISCALMGTLAPAQTLSDVGIVSFRGTYSAGRTYTKGDEVAYNGSLYVSTTGPNLNSTPGSVGSPWQLMPGATPPAATSTTPGIAQLAAGTANTTAENVANKGVANGYAPLDGTGKVPTPYLPTITGGSTTFAGLTDAPTANSQLAGDLNAKVSKAGDTLTGPLVLAADPTASNQAATKNYVDTHAVVGPAASIPGSANQNIVSNGSNVALATPNTTDPVTGGFTQNYHVEHSGYDNQHGFNLFHMSEGQGAPCDITNNSGCGTDALFNVVGYLNTPGQNVWQNWAIYCDAIGDCNPQYFVHTVMGDEQANAEWQGGPNWHIDDDQTAAFFTSANTNGATSLTGITNGQIPVGGIVFPITPACTGTVTAGGGSGTNPHAYATITCSSALPSGFTGGSTFVESSGQIGVGTNVSIPITSTPSYNTVVQSSLSTPGACVAGADATITETGGSTLIAPSYEKTSVVSTTATSITLANVAQRHNVNALISCGAGINYGVEQTANSNTYGKVQVFPIIGVVSTSGNSAVVMYPDGPAGPILAIPTASTWASGNNGMKLYNIAQVLTSNTQTGVVTVSPNNIAFSGNPQLIVAHGIQNHQGMQINMKSSSPSKDHAHSLSIVQSGYDVGQTNDTPIYIQTSDTPVPGRIAKSVVETQGDAGSHATLGFQWWMDDPGNFLEVQDQSCYSGTTNITKTLANYDSGGAIKYTCGNNSSNWNITGTTVALPGAVFGWGQNDAAFQNMIVLGSGTNSNPSGFSFYVTNSGYIANLSSNIISSAGFTGSSFGPSGTGHSPGLVPDPGATGGTSRFLREDGTWVAPAGGGGGTNPTTVGYQYWNGSAWVNSSSDTATFQLTPSPYNGATTAPTAGNQFVGLSTGMLGLQGADASLLPISAGNRGRVALNGTATVNGQTVSTVTVTLTGYATSPVCTANDGSGAIAVVGVGAPTNTSGTTWTVVFYEGGTSTDNINYSCGQAQ